MEFEKLNIECSNFLDVKATIERTEVKVREARSLRERQYYAQDISLEAETLLSCSDYNAANTNCVNCHTFSHRYIHEYKQLAKSQGQADIVKY